MTTDSLDISRTEHALPTPIAAEPAPRHHSRGVVVGSGKGAVTVGGGAPIVVQ